MCNNAWVMRGAWAAVLVVLSLSRCTGVTGTLDAGTGVDAAFDAGPADASIFDAGFDAGDAGPPDASIHDAGLDAGVDAGLADASVVDAGFDAGSRDLVRPVFAHYMVAIRTYGGGLDASVRDIREALDTGINGFALNLGSWRNGNYATDVAALFEAAHSLDAGFSLFFSADMSGDLTGPDLVNMMRQYANDPSYFRHAGRPVLSTYAGEAGGAAVALPFWRDEVLSPLRDAGIDPFFVPGFFMTNFALVTPQTVEADYQSWWRQVIDGAFFFGAAGLPVDGGTSLAAQNEALAAGMHAHQKIAMASVTPQYWGGKQPTAGRRYYEFNGGEGLEAQWRSIIEVQQADWVELVTWNDFGEASYFTPCDDVNQYWPYEYVTVPGFFPSHAGASALQRYFIEWYRTDRQPPITRDALFYFYRTHPWQAVASADPHGAVTEFHGEMTDSLFITVLSTGTASLRVSSGGTVSEQPVVAGLQHLRVPFHPGAQHFELRRDGGTVLQTDGRAIDANPTLYNFSYATGSVSTP